MIDLFHRTPQINIHTAASPQDIRRIMLQMIFIRYYPAFISQFSITQFIVENRDTEGKNEYARQNNHRVKADERTGIQLFFQQFSHDAPAAHRQDSCCQPHREDIVYAKRMTDINEHKYKRKSKN